MPIISASIRTFKLTKMLSRENNEKVNKDSYLFLESHLLLHNSTFGSTKPNCNSKRRQKSNLNGRTLSDENFGKENFSKLFPLFYSCKRKKSQKYSLKSA